jgi:hypothetical protein
MKFVFEEIIKNKTLIEMLTVHSYEMNIYLVSVSIGGNKGLVCESGGRPKRFNSSQHIRDAFAVCKVVQAHMQHDTPYEEMIGAAAKSALPGLIPFTM